MFGNYILSATPTHWRLVTTAAQSNPPSPHLDNPDKHTESLTLFRQYHSERHVCLKKITIAAVGNYSLAHSFSSLMSFDKNFKGGLRNLCSY